MTRTVTNNGKSIKPTLAGVCDVWECLSACYGVQITMEMTYGVRAWPEYCEALFTVYHTHGELPEIILQVSALYNSLHNCVTANDIDIQLHSIEMTMSRDLARYAAPNAPVHLLFGNNFDDSWGVMRMWWNSQGRGEHV